MSFKDKTVWITGASSGIGASLARAFDAEGARCVLSARNVERLETVRVACAHPARHVVIPLDVTDFDSHEPAVEKVWRDVGPVDVLVVNSGISLRGTGLETGLDVVRRIMDVNFFGAVSPTRIVARRMVERGSGRIVVISSVTGYVSTPGRTAYAASKHALHGWFNGFRAELHGTGVEVTIVTPGYVRTEISQNSLRADGSVHGRLDRFQAEGMDPDRCARTIVRGVRRGKAELAVGGVETLAIPLVRFLPSLVRRFLPGHQPE